MRNNFIVKTTHSDLLLEKIYSFIIRYYKLKKEKGFTNARDLFPNFELMEKTFKIERHELRNYLRKLEDLGKIKRDISQYFLVKNSFKKEKKEPAKTKEIPSKIRNIKKENINKSNYDIKIILLKIIMSIVGIISVGMSIYFTYLLFTEFFNTFVSFIFSVCWILFSVSSFEIIILFKQKKQRILFSLFIFLWGITTVFSMFSTLSGQLELQNKKERKNDLIELSDSNNIFIYNNYVKELNDYKIELQAIRKEREILFADLNNYNTDTTSDRKEYKKIKYLIYLRKKEIELWITKIEKKQKQINGLLEKNVHINVTKPISFYLFLERILKIKAEIFQLILYLFPALFIDIIAPVSFAILLFYKNNAK